MVTCVLHYVSNSQTMISYVKISKYYMFVELCVNCLDKGNFLTDPFLESKKYSFTKRLYDRDCFTSFSESIEYKGRHRAS